MAYEIAVPEENSASFQDYLDALRRRGGTALKLAAAVFVLGLLAIFFWPNTYRSTATILIEDPDIPPGLVPTTVTTFAARQIQYINQRVMTRTNLAQIIEKFDLYAEERRYLPTLLLVKDVEKDVKIDIIDAPDAGSWRAPDEHHHRLHGGLRDTRIPTPRGRWPTNWSPSTSRRTCAPAPSRPPRPASSCRPRWTGWTSRCARSKPQIAQDQAGERRRPARAERHQPAVPAARRL